jgi:hypothetical protein
MSVRFSFTFTPIYCCCICDLISFLQFTQRESVCFALCGHEGSSESWQIAHFRYCTVAMHTRHRYHLATNVCLPGSQCRLLLEACAPWHHSSGLHTRSQRCRSLRPRDRPTRCDLSFLASCAHGGVHRSVQTAFCPRASTRQSACRQQAPLGDLALGIL